MFYTLRSSILIWCWSSVATATDGGFQSTQWQLEYVFQRISSNKATRVSPTCGLRSILNLMWRSSSVSISGWTHQTIKIGWPIDLEISHEFYLILWHISLDTAFQWNQHYQNSGHPNRRQMKETCFSWAAWWNGRSWMFSSASAQHDYKPKSMQENQTP